MDPISNAEGDDTHPIVEIFAVIAAVMVACYHAYLLFCRPEQWQELKRSRAEDDAAKGKEVISVRAVTKGGQS